VATHHFMPTAAKEDYYVAASRLVPYKRMPLIAEAFAAMPGRRLVLIGDGPDMARVRKAAGPNVEVLGHVDGRTLRHHLERARGFVFAAEEDFGIAPVEAQAAGTPVIALGRGGALDTVVEGLSGVLFAEQSIAAIREAVDRFEDMSFDAEAVAAHAARFSEGAFRRRLYQSVMAQWAAFNPQAAVAVAGKEAA
jgi:glycosyltransferase involved in cell wall biosynthesis